MTNREFYNAIAAGTMNNDIQTFAKEAIEKMDARNETRKAKPSKTAIENEPIKAKILELITERGEFCIAKAIAESVEISVQKASRLCQELVEAGKLVKKDVTVPKQGRRKAYGVE